VEVYLGAFAAGIGATVTPCILPLYPAFLAYITGAGDAAERSWAGRPAVAALLVWVGVVAGMVSIGAVFAALATPLNDFIRVVLPIADVLLIVLGLLLIGGRNPFARLPRPSGASLGGHGPAVSAVAYGLLFAPIAVPCSGPFLVGIFAFSFTLTDAAARLLFFLAFGIGFGLPLFVIGALGQARGRQLAAFLVRHERPLQVIVGLALVAVGLWDLTVNLGAIVG
jgi:cytochrome c-type biogenesis protein